MDVEELLALEHEGWLSLCEGTGAEFYGRIMTEDGVMLLADGTLLDRDAVIASLGEAPPWQEYEIVEPRSLALGPESRALVYRGRAAREAGPVFTALMSSVYARRAGEWRLVLYQQTPVGGTR